MDIKSYINCQVTVSSACVICETDNVSLERIKLNWINEGFGPKVVLRFGRGTEDVSQSINASFLIDRLNLEELEITSTAEIAREFIRLRGSVVIPHVYRITLELKQL
jgi:hypothetical protein